MPGKADHRTRGSADVLDDVRLKDIFGHAKRLTFRVEVFLLKVVAIVTIQVTERTGRFCKYLKFAGSFDHDLIPHLLLDQETVHGFIKVHFYK